MTSVQFDQIRFNTTHTEERKENAHQLQTESENCKGAKESNLNVQVSYNSCFNHHSVHWFYSNRHNSLLVLLATPFLGEKGSSAVQGLPWNSLFTFRSLNTIFR